MKTRILSLLLCLALIVGLMPVGMLSVSAAEIDTADTAEAIDAADTAAEAVDAADTAAEIEDAGTGGDHSTADDPWIVTDYTHLKIAFNTSSDHVVYIKLGSDISFSDSGDFTLKTLGYNVVLDLAGYTLSCKDQSNWSHRLIQGVNGRVTINDSKRTDSSGKTVEGKIDYKLDGTPYKGSNTSVMSGKITVNGGIITNNTSSDEHHSVYTNIIYTKNTKYAESGSFRMNGGVFKAKTPILLYHSSDCVFDGGELQTTGQVGVCIDHKYFSSNSIVLPTFKKLTITKKSSNTNIYPLVLFYHSDYASSHTHTEMIAGYSSMFPSNVYQFKDGIRQSSILDGVTYGSGCYYAPKVTYSYQLAALTVLSELNLTITQPRADKEITYTASCPADAAYAVNRLVADDYTKNGVSWGWWTGKMWAAYKADTTNYFSSNIGKYMIKVHINYSPTHCVFADNVTVKVNGHDSEIFGDAQQFTDNRDGTCTVRCDFKVRKAVNSFALTIEEPKVGNNIKYSASYPNPSSYAVESSYNGGTWRNGVSWTKNDLPLSYSSTNKFETGNSYTVFISIILKDPSSCEFALLADCTATVNGKEATVYKIADDNYGVSCKFGFPVKSISSVDLTITEPLIGAKPAYDAKAPSDADYVIQGRTGGDWKNGVCWTDSDNLAISSDTVFEEGKTYKCVISVETKDSDRFLFANAFSATVNGKKAAVFKDSTDNTRYWIVQSFTVQKKQIDQIEVTVPEPKAGDIITYEATTPDGAGYRIANYNNGTYESGVMWEDNYGAYSPQDDNYFEDGEDYIVRIMVDIANPAQYEFAPWMSMEAYVNGTRADLNKISDTRYRVSFSFTPSAEQYTVGDVNMDGSVTNKDSLILDRKLAKWAGYDDKIKIKTLADLNRDESITNKDSLILNRYLAKWTGYDKYIIKVTV